MAADRCTMHTAIEFSEERFNVVGCVLGLSLCIRMLMKLRALAAG